jgi:hypothetical protein
MINLSSNEAFSIVTIGSWNPAIFSPEWAKNNLAVDKDKDVILAIPMQMGLPPRLTVDEVNIYPSTMSLMIDCIEYGKQSRDACSQKLEKIASLLEHTPVTGVGINFRFAFDIAEATTLIDLFSFNDASKIDSSIYRLSSSGVKRSFLLHDSTMLNLSIESNADKFLCEFNFHSDIRQLSEVIDKTSIYQIESYHNQAVEFIDTVYDIDLND